MPETALQVLQDIRDEIVKQRQAMDRLANSSFGLAKDLRKWFKSRTTQPSLNFESVKGTGEEGDNLHACEEAGCNWKGPALDWYNHAHDIHGRALPDFILNREPGWDE